MHQLDVETAYLNGPIDKEIYLRFPEVYTPAHEGSNCVRLLKGIYGLEQAGRIRWKQLDSHLEQMSFSQTSVDWGIYRECDAIILVCGDDILVVIGSTKVLEEIKTPLMKRWEMTDSGNVSFLLGIKNTRDRKARRLTVSQAAYVDAILARFDMANCKVSHSVGA